MVIFRESDHSYTNVFNGISYISATTVIGKYKEPFDKDYWSLYKAIERFITRSSSYNGWVTWKKKVKFNNVTSEFLRLSNPSQIQEVRQIQSIILSEWDEERDIACFNGTNFHKAQENNWLASPEHSLERGTFVTGNDSTSKSQDDFLGESYLLPKRLEDLEDGVYSELTLWSNYFQVAGQADIVYIETINGIRYIDIDDYKTNKKIEEKSFKSRKGYAKMLYPVNSIMDCNYCHYNLQTSLYAFLLEEAGYTVRKLEFQHWNNVGTKKVPSYVKNKVYKMPYLRKEVMAMLTHYKKNKCS